MIMNKSNNEDPIEGALQQGVNKKEYTNALLLKKKVKKRKKKNYEKEILDVSKALSKKFMKSLGFKFQSPPKIIIKIEHHFHSTVNGPGNIVGGTVNFSKNNLNE